jgi:tRNA-dihydrouridine synthase B
VFKVGDITISAPVFLAPMSGVTDAAFRTQAAAFGAPAVVTEMVAGAELASQSVDFLRRAAPHSGQGPFIVQLVGRDPAWMRVGAELAEAAGADLIDINMGCPAKKVTGGQSGCALMREPDLARRLIAAAIAGTSRPVSVKMRLGWDAQTHNAPEIARIAEAEGAQLVTVHGRTRNQFYEGKADWTAIAPVVDAVSIPVIANGDILETASARRALDNSGAAGVMVGRGAIGRPWRLAQIATELAGGVFTAPAWGARLQSMRTQILDSSNLYGERLGVRVVRKHVAAFVDALQEDEGLPDALTLRKRLCQHDTVSALLDDLLSSLEPVRTAA